jgi:hypothetical protein
MNEADLLRQNLANSEFKIEQANRIINEYCEGCSRLKKQDCTLKLVKSCKIKELRVALNANRLSSGAEKK